MVRVSTWVDGTGRKISNLGNDFRPAMRTEGRLLDGLGNLSDAGGSLVLSDSDL